MHSFSPWGLILRILCKLNTNSKPKKKTRLFSLPLLYLNYLSPCTVAVGERMLNGSLSGGGRARDFSPSTICIPVSVRGECHDTERPKEAVVFVVNVRSAFPSPPRCATKPTSAPPVAAQRVLDCFLFSSPLQMLGFPTSTVERAAAVPTTVCPQPAISRPPSSCSWSSVRVATASPSRFVDGASPVHRRRRGTERSDSLRSALCFR